MCINLENNEVEVLGTVSGEPVFSHEIYGEGFYCFTLNIKRLSDIYDTVSVTISERLMNGIDFCEGTHLHIKGQFRSYNNYGEGERKLMLTVFVKDIERCEPSENINFIYLNGFICKIPSYRTTPFGREITDLLIAVNRQYNKSDYIPCIAWGRNARFASNLQVGDNIRIWGRVQSREYQKHLSENEIVNRTAYEISISKLETVSEVQNHMLNAE